MCTDDGLICEQCGDDIGSVCVCLSCWNPAAIASVITTRLLELQRYSVHLVNHPHPANQYWSLHLYAIDGPGRDKIWTGPLYEVIDAAWDYTRKPRWYDETN